MPRTAGPGARLSRPSAAARATACTDFATWSVLVEQHGPRFDDWPAELQHPSTPAVAAFAAPSTRTEIDFHCWLQWLLDEQLAAAHQAGRRAGMALGIMHDLAVGVHPYGADAWALQDTLRPRHHGRCAAGPLQPERAELEPAAVAAGPAGRDAYAPYREMVSTILRHAGGIRVDHVIGLFRLWWIPAGAGPTEGTYVRYDHEAMVGILALEAQRAGAVVVGEDLGTVEPWVRTYLRERGILGTSILWFEFDCDGDQSPLAPEQWREYCLASVTTHDLPPTAGYLAGDHVRLRDRLGVLTRPLAEELAVDEAERQAWLDNLRRRGAARRVGRRGGDGAGAAPLPHLDPSRLLSVALTDAVGDRRVQNQPGTIDEYPNWRVPLSGPDGQPSCWRTC